MESDFRTTFSGATTYQKRLDQLHNDRSYYQTRLPSARNEIGWINHFIDVHGMKPGLFSKLRANLRAEAGVSIPGSLVVYRLSEGALKEMIARFRKKENRKFLAEIAKNPLVAAWDARTVELTDLLRRAYKPKVKSASATPEKQEKPIDRKELKVMIDADLVYCPFADQAGSDSP